MDSEKILPSDLRLNTYFFEFDDEVKLDVDEIKHQYGDILDHDVEFDNPNDPIILLSLARIINGDVAVVGDDREALAATYRALLFSYQTAKMSYGKSAQFNAAPYFDTLSRAKDPYEFFLNDTQDYLALNPNVHDFLQYYLEDFDDSGAHHQLAESAGALLFMLVERDLGEKFLAEDVKNLSVDELDK